MPSTSDPSAVEFYRTQLSLSHHHLHSALDALLTTHASLSALADDLGSEAVRGVANELRDEVGRVRMAIERGEGLGLSLCGRCGAEVEDVVVPSSSSGRGGACKVDEGVKSLDISRVSDGSDGDDTDIEGGEGETRGGEMDVTVLQG